MKINDLRITVIRYILMNKKRNNKAINAGIGYTIGNYLIKGLSFLTIPIFVRMMSTSDYGKYNTFLAYESILFILIGMAIHSSYKNARYKYKVISEGAKEGDDYYSYVSSTMLLISVSGLIWIVLVNVFSPVLEKSLHLNRLSLTLLIIYGFSSAVITCYNTDAGIEYNYKRFLKIAGFNSCSNILFSIILITTVFSNNRYLGRVVGTVIPIFLCAIYILFYFYNRAKISQASGIKEKLRWGIKYSLPIIPHGLSQIILNQFDRIMISQMISDAATGIYSFGYNIYSIIAVTFNSLDSVWSPWFYEKMNNKEYKKIKEVSSVYILLMCIFCSFVILLSPEIINILGDDDYLEAIYCVIPIVGGGFFAFLYTIPSSIEYYFEKTKYIAIGTMSAAVINIILNYIFIKKFGYVAAAYTTLVTYLLYFLFHFLLAKRILGYNLFSSKVIFLSVAEMLVLSIFSNFIIDLVALRVIIAILLVILGIIIEEKYIGYFKKQRTNN